MNTFKVTKDRAILKYAFFLLAGMIIISCFFLLDFIYHYGVEDFSLPNLKFRYVRDIVVLLCAELAIFALFVISRSYRSEKKELEHRALADEEEEDLDFF